MYCTISYIYIASRLRRAARLRLAIARSDAINETYCSMTDYAYGTRQSINGNEMCVIAGDYTIIDDLCYIRCLLMLCRRAIRGEGPAELGMRSCRASHVSAISKRSTH